MLVATAVHAQETAMKSPGQNIKEMKFVPFPGLPACTVGSVQNGDPSKGPSIILAKIEAGCTIPWHWHTPNENLMLVQGVAHIEMKDGKPFTMEAGGFASMPSQHVHQFHCERACTLYIHSDTAFDIHYVNSSGKEISPEEALKPMKKATSQ
jgi:quercetin dioxygenase-like cupin family protein